MAAFLGGTGRGVGQGRWQREMGGAAALRCRRCMDRVWLPYRAQIAEANAGCVRFRLRPRERQVFGSTSGMAMRPRIIAAGMCKAGDPAGKTVAISTDLQVGSP
jgi:hypothetical protein